MDAGRGKRMTEGMESFTEIDCAVTVTLTPRSGEFNETMLGIGIPLIIVYLS